jgi:hypothetical protein
MFAELRLKLLEKVISSLLQFGWYLYLDCVVERGDLRSVDGGCLFVGPPPLVPHDGYKHILPDNHILPLCP